MNKKSIDKITNYHNYNALLIQSSAAIVSSFRNIISKTDQLPPQDRKIIADKQRKLEIVLKNSINVFGKFVDIHKTPLASPLDYSLDIFQAISDNIQTSVQKYRLNAKNSKNDIKTERNLKTPSKRPQDVYKNIKPAKFEFHNHEKDLQNIRTDLSFTPSRSLEEGYTYVDTEKLMVEMVNDLKKENEMAVDVEHSNKSYEGLTCLIQVSSRSKDYIVDVFPIWEHVGLLKQVMEDPQIVKVMHGADMDTKWLQRDFNIHIHNLFDTYRAARTLGKQKLSYGFLLNNYCNVTTDKTYQTADWRQRPLSSEMLHYARLDTHFLLEIFDRMRNDLHQKALSMSLDPQDVFIDVYSISHEVTRTEVQLFEFRNKECLINLSKQFKKPDYAIFEEIFAIFNEIAQENDVSFDELVNQKLERLIISKLKELLLVKPQNITIKIDRLISDLKGNDYQDYFKPFLGKIKENLTSFFASRKTTTNKEKIGKKAKVENIAEQLPVAEPEKKKQKFFKINFMEYNEKTYQNFNINPFSMVVFEPIASFIANRFGVTQKQDPKREQQMSVEEQEIDEDEEEDAVNEEKQSQNNDGVIEFKRINPNVIYTIEEAEPVQKQYKPRKKRKELEYQKKLKDGQSNIYDMLED